MEEVGLTRTYARLAAGFAAVWTTLAAPPLPCHCRPTRDPAGELFAAVLPVSAAAGIDRAKSQGRVRLTPAGLSKIQREIVVRRGSPLLVNFWAEWCEPCVQELPDLAGIEEKLSKTRVRLLGISCDLLVEDDSPGLRRKVERVLEKAGALYQNLLYTGREEPLVDGFDLPGPLPFSILYGADGTELKRWTGVLPLDELEGVLGAR